MRVGYLKVGRSMGLRPEQWGVVGGDDEPPLLLKRLALDHPEIEWVIVGINPGDNPQECGFPSNVINPWGELRPIVKSEMKQIPYEDKKRRTECMHHLTRYLFETLDGLICWAGQHGTSNTPIPPVGSPWGNEFTNPQDSFMHYAGWIVQGINYWREGDPLAREEIWLHPDPRNYNKARDLKWPPRLPLLGQYNEVRPQKHERYLDMREPKECGFDATWEGDHVWVANHRYVYSRLEICGIRPEHIDGWYSEEWKRPGHFGLFINEARAYVAKNRKDALRDWVLPLNPYFVNGKWSDESLRQLGVDIQPAPSSVYYDRLRSVRCTFTTPSSGSGWATTKPWQAFAVGTVCFFHPDYDTQGHIIPTRPTTGKPKLDFLSEWLRVKNPGDLRDKMLMMNQDEDLWREVVKTQRAYYDYACEKDDIGKHIAERLGL